MNTPDRSGIGALAYDLLLSLAAGFSLGWFSWIVADRLGSDGTAPLWPFVAGAVALTFLAVRWIRSRGEGRWVHLLWIPVAVFAALMTMIVLALRNFT